MSIDDKNKTEDKIQTCFCMTRNPDTLFGDSDIRNYCSSTLS